MTRPKRPTGATNQTASLLSRFGNMADLAREIDVAYVTVASWKHRGSVPERYWRPIAAAAAKLEVDGVTYAALSDAAAAQPGRPGGSSLQNA